MIIKVKRKKKQLYMLKNTNKSLWKLIEGILQIEEKNKSANEAGHR